MQSGLRLSQRASVTVETAVHYDVARGYSGNARKSASRPRLIEASTRVAISTTGPSSCDLRSAAAPSPFAAQAKTPSAPRTGSWTR